MAPLHTSDLCLTLLDSPGPIIVIGAERGGQRAVVRLFLTRIPRMEKILTSSVLGLTLRLCPEKLETSLRSECFHVYKSARFAKRLNLIRSPHGSFHYLIHSTESSTHSHLCYRYHRNTLTTRRLLALRPSRSSSPSQADHPHVSASLESPRHPRGRD